MIINTCQINLVYMVNGTKNKFFMCESEKLTHGDFVTHTHVSWR